MTPWERVGVFAAPSTPREPNVGFVIFCRLRRIGWGLQKSAPKAAMRGAGKPVCGMRRFDGQHRGAPALAAFYMPHTLRTLQCSPLMRLHPSVLRVWQLVIFIIAATATSFMMARGSASAVGTRAPTPVCPRFSFKKENKKRGGFLRKFNIGLRQKPSKRRKIRHRLRVCLTRIEQPRETPALVADTSVPPTKPHPQPPQDRKKCLCWATH